MGVASLKPGSIAEMFKIREQEHRLPFFNALVDDDTAYAIDPLRLLGRRSLFVDCHALIRDYFTKLIRLIRSHSIADAIDLTEHLREPALTRLGVCGRGYTGNGLGDNLCNELVTALSCSKAVSSGFIEDIEDLALFIPRIAEDRVSDLVTNVIAHKLAAFTDEQISLHHLDAYRIGHTLWGWDATLATWTKRRLSLLQPINGSRPLLLVPRELVSSKLLCSAADFYEYARSKCGLTSLLQATPSCDIAVDAQGDPIISAAASTPAEQHANWNAAKASLIQLATEIGLKDNLISFARDCPLTFDRWIRKITTGDASLADVMEAIQQEDKRPDSKKAELLLAVGENPDLLRQYKASLLRLIPDSTGDRARPGRHSPASETAKNPEANTTASVPQIHVKCSNCCKFVTRDALKLHQKFGCS